MSKKTNKKSVVTFGQVVAQNVRHPINPFGPKELVQVGRQLVRSGQTLSARVINANPEIIYVRIGDREIEVKLARFVDSLESYPEFKAGDEFQVRAIDLHKRQGIHTLYVARASENLPHIIRREFASMGGWLWAIVIGKMDNPATPGLIVRTGPYFRARLFLSDIAEETHGLRLQRLELLPPGKHIKVRLISVSDTDGKLRIKVGHVREAHPNHAHQGAPRLMKLSLSGHK